MKSELYLTKDELLWSGKEEDAEVSVHSSVHTIIGDEKVSICDMIGDYAAFVEAELSEGSCISLKRKYCEIE